MDGTHRLALLGHASRTESLRLNRQRSCSSAATGPPLAGGGGQFRRNAGPHSVQFGGNRSHRDHTSKRDYACNQGVLDQVLTGLVLHQIHEQGLVGIHSVFSLGWHTFLYCYAICALLLSWNAEQNPSPLLLTKLQLSSSLSIVGNSFPILDHNDRNLSSRLNIQFSK